MSLKAMGEEKLKLLSVKILTDGRLNRRTERHIERQKNNNNISPPPPQIMNVSVIFRSIPNIGHVESKSRPLCQFKENPC